MREAVAPAILKAIDLEGAHEWLEYGDRLRADDRDLAEDGREISVALVGALVSVSGRFIRAPSASERSLTVRQIALATRQGLRPKR